METLKILKFGGGVDIELSPTFGTSTLPCRDQQGITEIHLTKQSRDSINLKELESSLGEDIDRLAVVKPSRSAEMRLDIVDVALLCGYP
ncbi:unnamed protein product [Brassica oleracea var. botrytis]|uniref:(rape) hypothetical protein n=1 Tax=Brassica napus TaxID=3708 RepID=A0A816KHI8_BRANA|nr:unnamed protein product [Brassica napus]